jgi:cytochrome c
LAEKPARYADGTKMTFAGLESAEDRAAVMVYLNAQGSNKPLPAVPAAKAVRQRLRVTPHPPPTARPLRRNPDQRDTAGADAAPAVCSNTVMRVT